MKKKFETHQIEQVFEKEFYGIDVLESKEEYGFEGYWNDDINHPDHRPAHQIWIKKKDAEKLIRIFYRKFAEQVRKAGYDYNYTLEELNNRGVSASQREGKD